MSVIARTAMSLALLSTLAVPSLAQRDATGKGTEKQRQESDVVVRSGFGSSDIRGWRAVDDSTLIVDTYSRGELVATFTRPCVGIDGAETLGFSTTGPFELDRTTKVILPNGFHCQFESLRRRQASETTEQ